MVKAPADAFFDLQHMVVDAAWAISAGGDTERLDAVTRNPARLDGRVEQRAAAVAGSPRR